MYWLSIVLFVIAYVLILSEKIDKTKVTMLGGCLMLAFQVLEQHEAFYSERLGIDHNVIFLLIGMMLLVYITSQSGVFEFVAIQAAQKAKGNPQVILFSLAILTAISSALLDNVTTVLLLSPVILLIGDELEISPVPFLISCALASNIGGTATLIGDPPNIMIASKTNFSFMDFLVNLGPLVVILIVIFVVYSHFVFGRKMKVKEENVERLMLINSYKLIRNKPLMYKSLSVLFVTLVGFLTHSITHIEPATIALTGGIFLLFISKEDAHVAFEKIEWHTIFFFIGLFLMVGGLVKTGVVEDLSRLVVTTTNPTAESTLFTGLVLIWFSGIASAVVDNIPYVATMIPIIANISDQLGNPEVVEPLWWSLALGACLGGNGSPVGASANVIALGFCAKSGSKVSFLEFVKLGLPITIITLAMATGYVYLRYYS